MADIIIIIPKIRKRKERTVPPPFVFLRLAAALEKENFKSILIDARVDTDYLLRIENELKKNPLFVGITAMTGVQSVQGLKISRFIKKINPTIPVVWGGVHASLLPEELLDDRHVDVAVIGEGELSIVSFAKKYISGDRTLDGIKGIAFREDGRIVVAPKEEFIDPNILPMPAWHLVNDRMKYYCSEDEESIDIITSAGCPHDCYFCYNMSYNESRFRGRPAESVLDEIIFLNKKHGIKKIGFCDDNFLVDKKRVIGICEGLAKKGIVLDLRCDARVDYLNDKYVSYLAGNGFKTFFLGIESGSQKMLDLINKRTTVKKIKEGVLALSRHTDGGHVYSFMIGLPDETKEDIKKTWEFARWIYGIDKKACITLSIYTPYPGVELTNILAKRGYRIPKSNEEWMRYDPSGVENKKWIQEARLVKSLANIFRLSFNRSENKLARFLSRYAKKRFLTGRLRTYPEFEMFYYLLRNF